MLPAGRTQSFSLADVLPNCLAALAGEPGPMGLPPVGHALVLLADGLGAANLQARRGHARRLAARLDADPMLDTGFPTTTAAALASLTTAERPGVHGMVGYTVLDPSRNQVVNELSGWEESDLDPTAWQRSPTLFERAGVPSVAIGLEKHRGSGFSRAVLRGAEYRAAAGLADLVLAARTALDEPGPRLIYVYAPELDAAAHKAGAASKLWTEALEALDSVAGRLADVLGPEQGMLVTGDHGIVDVDRAGHRIVPPALLAGVRHIAGEPRGLQLHVEPGVSAQAVAAAFRSWTGDEGWVATRDEAIAEDWFGEVDPEVLPRIGDVLVLARDAVAYYADPAANSRGMIGQHGSLTEAERTVPLLHFGAFAPK